MSRLCKQAVVTQLEADVPGGLLADRLGYDCVQKAASSYLNNERRVDLVDLVAEDLSHLLSVLGKLLFLYYSKGGYCNLCSQRESSEG